MKPRQTVLLIAVFCLMLNGLTASVLADEPVVLKVAAGRLSIMPDGGMDFTPNNAAAPVWETDPERLWGITICEGADPFKLAKAGEFVSGKNRPTCRKIDDGVVLTYDKLANGDKSWDIKLELTVKKVNDEFQFSAVFTNNTKNWTVRDFKFPILFELKTAGGDNETLGVLWPEGLGQRFPGPKAWGRRRTFTYPSAHATMQWCAIENAGKDSGLYLGSHDANRSRKVFAIANYDTHYDFAITYEPFCTPGKTWNSPPFVVMPFNGTWHTAARRYRAWTRGQMQPAAGPDWVVNNSGWFLCILKQQNGDLMFRYDQLDEVADIADEWGFDVLGLFGWAHGGHDRYYPDYIPDPKMGGPEVLKKAIKRVQARGKKVILYANGQLIDSATEFYRVKGMDAMIHDSRGKGNIQMYNKFKSTTTPIFVQACLGSKVWRERMIALGKQAQDLGADGILYDQLGVMTPVHCYAKEHGHATPAAAWAECRFELVKAITDALHKRDPNFVVMTEGLVDGLMGHMPYYHGCVPGNFTFKPTPGQITFPDMFRYTFPELVQTQRNPNPLMDRTIANFACFFGLRHEIESRYTADVTYLKQEKMPKAKDYADCNSPPQVPLVLATPPGPAAAYCRALTAFERRHAKYLWQGSFIDNEGIEFAGKNSGANGFLAADGSLGVLVWNYGEEPEAVKVAVPGFRLEAVFEPEKADAVDAKTPVPPESVRLYIWKKAGAK